MITDITKEYTHPDFTADPLFCPIRYEYTVPNLTNGNVLVTRDGKDFDIYYIDDLSPVDETVTVTVTAISMSGFTTNNEISVSADFDVNCEDPCPNPAYVTI